jgi:hypothetical protein
MSPYISFRMTPSPVNSIIYGEHQLKCMTGFDLVKHHNMAIYNSRAHIIRIGPGRKKRKLCMENETAYLEVERMLVKMWLILLDSKYKSQGRQKATWSMWPNFEISFSGEGKRRR